MIENQQPLDLPAGSPVAPGISALIDARSVGRDGLFLLRPPTAGGDATVRNSGDLSSSVPAVGGILAVSEGGAGATVPVGSASVAIGLGASAGDVLVENSGSITLHGDAAHGIAARSIGGPGGEGLSSAVEPWPPRKSAGAVTVILGQNASGAAPLISTTGNAAYGILATSAGGGDLADYQRKTGRLLAVTGGNGGAVRVALGEGRIVTAGEQSIGIVAQSIGGASGRSLEDKPGQHGGDGAAVVVTGDRGGSVTTQGSHADAILLQSIGGSGGNGASDSGSVAVGGDGGRGGAAGAITIDFRGALQTSGDHALGVLAQSIGGGGGRGGNATARGLFSAVAIGGSGGDGGQGGDINITTAEVTTAGAFSHGVNAQSVGGGGGHGGSATAEATSPIFSSSVAVGGSGGEGGNAGDILLVSTDDVQTTGTHSFGLFASSIGGGGGAGGSASAISVSAGAVSLTSAVAIGGQGGKGGKGGRVTITQNAGTEVKTSGAFSSAIVGHSIGGGGGTGGDARAISIGASTGTGSIAVSVAVGGSGSEGNSGGSVGITASGTVYTQGEFSNGLEALSVGGGGGHGGSATTISGTISAGMSLPIAVAVGGSGGKGGDSGSVAATVAAGATIETDGDHATGVLAQSIGGGGGNGGSAMSLAAAISEERSISISAAVGGSGGSGGHGGAVTVDVSGQVATLGQFSNAILAQSIGGGGGKGGNSLSLSVDASPKGSTPVSLAVGGSGGSGGDAGTVSVTTRAGSIMGTVGAHSVGVLAQSIGGGGGTGGTALSGSLSVAEESKPSAAVAIGGKGSGGGHGGLVLADLRSLLVTNGALAHGVLAQSIGGGGGFGGNALSAALSASTGEKAGKTIALSVAGKGGAGGHGGDVRINHSGLMTINGQGANAIMAQSIGGSGGYGGNAVAVTASVRPADEGSGKLKDGRTVSLSIGGNGGDGGDGGTVTVTNAGRIRTLGDTGAGILAQSVGGGGGAGGHATSIFLSGEKQKLFTSEDGQLSAKDLSKLTVSMGGPGGGFGVGGDVYVENIGGFIATQGDGSLGILAQSISGGGGASAVSDMMYHVESIFFGSSGASPYNHAGHVRVDNRVQIETAGLFSSGIVAQSIGGGGGAHLAAENLRDDLLGTDALSSDSGHVHLGGFGGNGSGTTVNVLSYGAITTHGDLALGILGQSIGGGGGLVTLDNAASTTAVDFGGSWDRLNRAESVTIENGGAITTHGKGSMGILAQSIGGGGGLIQANSPVVYIDSIETILANKNDRDRYDDEFALLEPAKRLLNFGGDININLTSPSEIRTYGDGATAVYAQSIAGPGGLVQQADGTILSKTYDRGDRAGNITINQHGLIETHGDKAAGIHAALLDGNYSWWEESSKREVKVSLQGSVDTYGASSHGIVTELSGNASKPEKQTEVDITIASGARLAVSGDQADAIRVTNATASHLATVNIVNEGLIFSADGYAIASDQMTSVTNAGTLSGSIMARGTIATPDGQLRGMELFNTASGIIHSGAVLDLGVDPLIAATLGGKGTLHNYGRFSPGGLGTIQTTALNGAYRGNSGSVLEVDLDMRTGSSDLLQTSAGAHLGGAVRAQLTSFGDWNRFTIATSPFLYEMKVDATALDTPVVNYSLGRQSHGFRPKAGFVTVDSIDFQATGLSDQDATTGQWLNQRLAAGDTDDAMVALANAATLSDYTALLESYASGHAAQQVAGLRNSASGFQSGTLSCGQIGAGSTAIDEGECAWAKVSSRWMEHFGGRSGTGRDDHSVLLSLGAQYALDENWRIGLAAGYETLTSQGRVAQTETDVAHLGAIAKYQQGNALYAFGLTYGHGWSRSTRAIPLSPDLMATASHDTDWLQARFRVAYLMPGDGFYLKPLIDVDVNYSRSGGYSERGAAGYNLQVRPYDDVQVSVAPGLEIGTDLDVSETMQLRAFAFAGAQHSHDTAVSTSVAFSSQSGSYSREFETDEWLANLGAGISLFSAGGSSLDIRYDGTFGDKIASHAVTAKLRVDF